MTLVNRKERWRQFQRCITARARVQFFYLLSERGFRGRLLANHKTKQLDLNVGGRLNSIQEPCLMRLRLSLTRQERAKVAKLKRSQEEKSRFQPSAYFYPSGMLWGPLFGASMNCETFFSHRNTTTCLFVPVTCSWIVSTGTSV